MGATPESAGAGAGAGMSAVPVESWLVLPAGVVPAGAWACVPVVPAPAWVPVVPAFAPGAAAAAAGPRAGAAAAGAGRCTAGFGATWDTTAAAPAEEPINPAHIKRTRISRTKDMTKELLLPEKPLTG